MALRGREGREEAARRAIEDRLNAYCNGDYNLISCANISFVYSIADVIRKVGNPSDVDFIPEFSRRATMKLYGSPPMARPDEVGKYVDFVFNAARNSFGAAFKYEFSLETRLTIHTRWPYLPLEIGISWHPILNVPYIPASSLKGAVRATSPEKVCGMDRAELFGTVEEEGVLVFFDAYPVRWERLVEPDVLTPHYREIEGEISEVQARPTPLVFPTVPPGTRFAFVVGIRRGEVPNNCAVELLEMLRGALTRGLGAKTAIGYGTFKRE